MSQHTPAWTCCQHGTWSIAKHLSMECCASCVRQGLCSSMHHTAFTWLGSFGAVSRRLERCRSLRCESDLCNLSHALTVRSRGHNGTYSTVLRCAQVYSMQVYSMQQARRDIDAVYSMGLFDDVKFLPQPAVDSTLESPTIDLTLQVKERKFGGLSAGCGISAQVT